MKAGGRAIPRLGTRASLLATAQSRIVIDELRRVHPHVQIELVTIRTTGDRITDRPLHEVGGKGVFTKEIEQALLDGRIDFAVHSFKDVPVTQPLVDVSRLTFAAVPTRGDARDVLVANAKTSVDHLPRGARVGTSSLRRAAQLLALRPDVKVEPIRGNVDTRLAKLRGGQYDAIILAMAGLSRAELFDEVTMSPIGFDQMLPAAGQGALVLQCRRDDARTFELLSPLNDRETSTSVAAERELVAILKGDCHSPIAVYVTESDDGGTLHMRAAVAARDGVPPVIRVSVTADSHDPDALSARAGEQLLAQGALKLLHG